MLGILVAGVLKMPLTIISPLADNSVVKAHKWSEGIRDDFFLPLLDEDFDHSWST